MGVHGRLPQYMHSLYLKLQLDPWLVALRINLCQLLESLLELRGRYGLVSTHYRFQQSIVDEDILWGGLNHVVATETHVTDKVEDIYDSLCLHLSQHGVNGDKGPCTTYASTTGGKGEGWLVCVGEGG